MPGRVSVYRTPPGRARLADARAQAIRETNAFLNWALAHERELPSIPRRRTSEGGFDAFVRLPGARAAIDQWWYRTLDLLRSYLQAAS